MDTNNLYNLYDWEMNIVGKWYNIFFTKSFGNLYKCRNLYSNTKSNERQRLHPYYQPAKLYYCHSRCQIFLYTYTTNGMQCPG